MINHLLLLIDLINNNMPITMIIRPRTVVSCVPKTGIYANSGKNLGCTYPIPIIIKPIKAMTCPKINILIHQQVIFFIKLKSLWASLFSKSLFLGDKCFDTLNEDAHLTLNCLDGCWEVLT